MSRPSSDQSYRPRTLVPARSLRKRDDAPPTAARAGFVLVVAVLVVASFPRATVAVASAYAAVRVVRSVVGRRTRRSEDGTTVRLPGVAVEVTVARTDGE